MRALLPVIPTMCLAAFVASVPAAAAEVKGVVTVFAFDYQESHVDKGSRIVLEEEVRSAAAEALGPAGYNVLTGETQLQLLSDNGVDPSKVCDSSCSLGAAREIKATYFITGVISASEGHHVGFVRLFRVKDGQQVRSIELEGKEIKEMREAFRKQSASFFASIPGSTRETTAAVPEKAVPVKSAPAAVSAVAPDMAPAGRFSANEATVYDPTSHLTWQRRVGKKAIFADMPDDYCKHLSIGGGGWRLPTKDELLSIVDTGDESDGPSIDRKAFPDTPGEWFWSSSVEGIGDFTQIWKINFADGRSEMSYVRGATAHPSRVRCVK